MIVLIFSNIYKGDKTHENKSQEDKMAKLQRGTFNSSTITKRSHSGRPSYQSQSNMPNFEYESGSQRRDSISSSDHSSLSSNASNYDSPYTSSLNINGK